MHPTLIAHDDWITTTVAAARLGITPVTLRKMVARGDAPPAYRLAGRTVRYRRSEVDAWVQSRASHSMQPVEPQNAPELLDGLFDETSAA